MLNYAAKLSTIITSGFILINAYAGEEKLTPPERSVTKALELTVNLARREVFKKLNSNAKDANFYYETYDVTNFRRGKYAPNDFSDFNGQLGLHFKRKNPDSTDKTVRYAVCDVHVSVELSAVPVARADIVLESDESNNVWLKATNAKADCTVH